MFLLATSTHRHTHTHTRSGFQDCLPVAFLSFVCKSTLSDYWNTRKQLMFSYAAWMFSLPVRVLFSGPRGVYWVTVLWKPGPWLHASYLFVSEWMQWNTKRDLLTCTNIKSVRPRRWVPSAVLVSMRHSCREQREPSVAPPHGSVHVARPYHVVHLVCAGS